jgi:hypothetical protein
MQFLVSFQAVFGQNSNDNFACLAELKTKIVISAPGEIFLKLKIKTMVGHLLLSLSLTYLVNEDTQQNRQIRVYISGIFAVDNSQERKRAIASPAVHESAEESQLARER